MRLHRSRWVFPLARVLSATFFFARTPYWLVHGLLHGQDRKKSLETAGTYAIGGCYCLMDWKRLLINRDMVGSRL
jgi:hypothetical protein